MLSRCTLPAVRGITHKAHIRLLLGMRGSAYGTDSQNLSAGQVHSARR